MANYVTIFEFAKWVSDHFKTLRMIYEHEEQIHQILKDTAELKQAILNIKNGYLQELEHIKFEQKEQAA